jgi:hypothetical protein
MPDTSRIAKLYDRVRKLRDSSLFEASRALLADRAATAESRVFSAMLVASQLVDRADPDYRVFATTGPHDACAIASATDRSIRAGTPLPSTASDEARSTALRVLTNESDPAAVKNAARCMYEALQRDERGYAQTPPTPAGGTHVTESSGRVDSAHVRAAADTRPRARPKRRPHVRASADSVRTIAGPARTTECVRRGGNRVHDGILRKSPRGDVLETSDGRRLPVANLPPALDRADGLRVWVAEPLGAPASAGIVDPSYAAGCAD